MNRLLRPGLFALGLLLTLSVAGCATSGTLPATGPSLPSAGDIDSTVQKIQDGVAKACGFVPTATTVLRIIETFAPSAAGAIEMGGVVVNGICSAVTSKGARRGLAPPKYRGVRIEGRRLSR